MQTLKLLEQVAMVRNEVIALLDGKSNSYRVRSQIEDLYDLLKQIERDNDPDYGAVAKTNLHEFEKNNPEIVDVAYNKHLQEELVGKLFLSSTKILLFEIERHEEGIAFQEKHGMVMFLENKNLKDLTPVETIKDHKGLSWKLELTDDENIVKAVNAIGDEIVGMKDVEKLLTGISEQEV